MLDPFWWIVIAVAVGNFLLRWLPFWWLRHSHNQKLYLQLQQPLETLGVMLIAALLGSSSLPAYENFNWYCSLQILLCLLVCGWAFMRSRNIGLAILAGLLFSLGIQLLWTA